ncbi:MAG: winged helix-turn-helix domain-containing protein, partial [Pseudomonadota bacterium]
AGKSLAIEPLVFDLIRFLAENTDRVSTRDDLIECVWQGRIVSDATIAGCIKSARKVLGDNGTKQRFIRTVRGRGFQFVADVTKHGQGGPATPPPEPHGNRATLPSLIVLPFQAFGRDPDLTALADGLVENMTTALVRVPLLSLASRSSSFALKGKAVSAADVRRDLGVDYMLEGSVQVVADKIRANVQLIETEGGFHLWAQQFDAAQGPTTLDDLLNQILPRLESQLVRAMLDSLGNDDGDLSARQLLLKASGLLSLKGWHKDTFEEAADLLRQAVGLEPDLALAHAHLALILGLGHRVGLLGKSNKVISEAADEAAAALRLDNMDSATVALAACALADIGQAERALPMLKRAIDLNPGNGHAFAALGSAEFILGQTDDAIENLKHGIAISPMDARLSVWKSVLALAHLLLGEIGAAKAAALDACQADHQAYIPHVVLAAVHLTAEDQDAARAAMGDCLRIKPDLSAYEIFSLVGRKTGLFLEKLKRSL